MKRSFKDLVKAMDALKENEQGMLKGGFASFSTEGVPITGANTNNATGCTCSGSGSNTNQTVGCSCSTTV